MSHDEPAPLPSAPATGEAPDPAREQWRATARAKAVAASPERRETFETTSGIPIRDVYTAADTAAIEPAALGLPGAYPFTRGVQPRATRRAPLRPDLPTSSLLGRRHVGRPEIERSMTSSFSLSRSAA